MSNKRWSLVVPMSFSETDLKEIIRLVNNYVLDESENGKLTIEEIKNSPKLQKYLIKELRKCKGEILEGSFSAVANDWLIDIDKHR